MAGDYDRESSNILGKFNFLPFYFVYIFNINTTLNLKKSVQFKDPLSFM